jgi:hypothetical protein
MPPSTRLVDGDIYKQTKWTKVTQFVDTYLLDKSVQNVWERPYCIEASCESSLLKTHQASSVLADLVYMLMKLATTLQGMSYVYPHKDLFVCLCWTIWLWKCQIEVEIYVHNPLEITTHRFQMELESNCHAKNLTLQLWEQIFDHCKYTPFRVSMSRSFKLTTQRR